MEQLRHALFAAFGLSLCIGALRANAQPNLLKDLGVGFGSGLNDNGQAVLSTGLYGNGVLTPLGMKGFAINASGQVAGETAMHIVAKRAIREADRTCR